MDSKSKNRSIWRAHLRVMLELELKSLLIIFSIFAFFALIGVIGQVYLPQILELSGLEISGLPDPSMESVFLDVWGDYLFTGAIIVIYYGSVAFSSDLGNEKSLYFYLSRPLSRSSYYLTRSLVKMGVVFGVSLVTSILVYGFALLFFDPIPLTRVLGGGLILSMGLVALMAVLLMINARFSTVVTLGVGIVIIVLMTLISILASFAEAFRWLSPFALSSIWQDILILGLFDDLLVHLLVLLGYILVPLGVGTYMFSTRDL